MVDILSKILLYFFASYGVLILLMTIVDSIRQRIKTENTMVKMVLLVKNQEESIEGIIRNVYIGNMLRKITSANQMSVVDMGSEDKTKEILLKMRKDYEFIDVFDKNEKEIIFKGFSD